MIYTLNIQVKVFNLIRGIAKMCALLPDLEYDPSFFTLIQNSFTYSAVKLIKPNCSALKHSVQLN